MSGVVGADGRLVGVGWTNLAVPTTARVSGGVDVAGRARMEPGRGGLCG